MKFVKAKLTAHKANLHVPAKCSIDTLASFAGTISLPFSLDNRHDYIKVI